LILTFVSARDLDRIALSEHYHPPANFFTANLATHLWVEMSAVQDIAIPRGVMQADYREACGGSNAGMSDDGN
jgi:hypothetical protein